MYFTILTFILIQIPKHKKRRKNTWKFEFDFNVNITSN